jgi:hypothetical protein
MSTASRSILAGLVLSLALSGTTWVNAAEPGTAAARPTPARPAPTRHAIPRPRPGSEINPNEAARIRHQVRQHKQMQRRAHADGSVSPEEQAALARDAAQVRELIQTARTN